VFQKQKKGELVTIVFEFTPLSLIPERLSCRSFQFQTNPVFVDFALPCVPYFSHCLRLIFATSLIRNRNTLKPVALPHRWALDDQRRSPEFIAQTVLLPDRFRVDCAFGGGKKHHTLSRLRANYSASRAKAASCKHDAG